MLLATTLLLGLTFGAQTPIEASSPAPADQTAWPAEVAARSGSTVVSFAELERALIRRHLNTEPAKKAILHLVEAGVLRLLRDERKVRVDEAQIEEHWRALDAEVRQNGEARDLLQYLEKEGVDPVEFREHLELAIVQETLARRDLGMMNRKRDLSAQEQQVWLDRQLQERGLAYNTPPYRHHEGVVAFCAGLVIREPEFGRELRRQVSRDEIRELCTHLLLAKKFEEQVASASDADKRTAVSSEVLRRKNSIESNPKYQGMKFFEVLKGQSFDVEKYHLDPAVRIASFSRLAVDRAYAGDALREAYEAEQSYFDGRYGEGVEARVLFLQAAERTNELNPRSFLEAERELERLAKEEIQNEDDFRRHVREKSEDAKSRVQEDGLWGVVTRGTEAIPAEVRSAIFASMTQNDGYRPDAAPTDLRARLLGPLRTQNGVCLVWLGKHRPRPGWDSLQERVHGELRSRMARDLLPKESIQLWLDRD